MAILEISSSRSKCLACGRETDLNSDRHDTILGYGPDNGDPGCGEKWTEVKVIYGHIFTDGVWQSEKLTSPWISDFIKNLHSEQSGKQ